MDSQRYYNPPFIAKFLALVLILAVGVIVDKKILNRYGKPQKSLYGYSESANNTKVSKQAGFHK